MFKQCLNHSAGGRTEPQFKQTVFILRTSTSWNKFYDVLRVIYNPRWFLMLDYVSLHDFLTFNNFDSLIFLMDFLCFSIVIEENSSHTLSIFNMECQRISHPPRFCQTLEILGISTSWPQVSWSHVVSNLIPIESWYLGHLHACYGLLLKSLILMISDRFRVVPCGIMWKMLCTLSNSWRK